MSASTFIIVVNYNGLDDTARCLRSIAAMGDPSVATVVVDNGSAADPTAPLAAEFPWCQVERLPSNTGWAGGNNAGIRLALGRGAERIILLNNDTVVDPRLVEHLVAAERAAPEFGIIGPVICYMDEPDVVMTDGCLFNRPGPGGFFRRRPIPLGGGPPAPTEVDIVNGCCMMISPRVVHAIGLIDERFFLIHEESDFCLRARRAGFRCGVINAALIWHKGSSSFRRAGSRVQRYYDTRNLYLLLRKHLGTLDRGRGALVSWVEFLKYAYYRYCIEREHGQLEAADGVICGLCDAVAGRYGGLRPRRRRGVPAVRWVFELLRKHYSRGAA